MTTDLEPSVSTRDLDTPPQPPSEGDPAPRRWSTGHTVAAAVAAVGVLASGGVALGGQLTPGDGGVPT
jgi:hypothetical protein